MPLAQNFPSYLLVLFTPFSRKSNYLHLLLMVNGTNFHLLPFAITMSIFRHEISIIEPQKISTELTEFFYWMSVIQVKIHPPSKASSTKINKIK
jgi:hypothetical protein